MLGTHGGMALRAAACPVSKPDSDGMLPHYRSYSWNQSLDKVRDHFVKHYANVTSAPGSKLDGTFLDTNGCSREPGQREGLLRTARAMQVAAPGTIVGLHASDSVRDRFTGVAAAMQYTLARPGGGAAAVAWMAANAANGVISLCHMGATLYSAEFNYSLATFLAGANDRAYFAFSDTYKKAEPLFEQRWTDCSPNFTSPLVNSSVQRYPWPAFPTWCAGQGYSPDFHKELGAPTSAAAEPTGRADGEVARSFASGSKVTIALNGTTCVIEWADGSHTVCAGGTRARAIKMD